MRATLAAFLFLALGANGQEALLDPLPIRDQFLLSNGFYFFEPEEARVLGDGEWAVAMHTTDANTFAKSAWISHTLAGEDDPRRSSAAKTLDNPRYTLRDAVFFVDGETHRHTLAVARGFGSHLQLAVAVPLTSVGGGWSDALIENVHSTLGLGDDNRNAFRRNRETVYFRTPATTYTRERGSGLELGDVAVSAKYELAPFEDDELAIAVQGAVELPTGDARTLDGSGSLDSGLQLLVSREFGSARVHATLGVLRLGANEPLGTRAQFLVTDTLAVAQRIGAATSAVAQLTISESPFRQFGQPEFSRRSYQMTFGIQHAFGAYVAHAAFIENLITYENSADAGFAWGVSRRF